MLALLLACASPEGLVPPDPGPLRADGARLADAHGRTVHLRGVNAGGRAKFAPYAPFEYDDWDRDLDAYLDRAASWGIDVLRVPFTWAALEPTPGDDDEAWLARYDALLDGAAARGMWTIVDAHQDIYSEVYCGDGFPAWTVEDPPDPHHDCPDWFLAYVSGDPEVDAAFDAFWADTRGTRTAFGAMWDRMVDHHAERPGVIGYELLNEPHRGTADADTWGAEVYTPFVASLAARAQARDPDALVFFDASGLDAVDRTPDFPRPEGENLVFAPHFYDASAFLGGTPDPDDVHDGLAQWADVRDDWEMPVLIGEVGVDPDSEAAGVFAEAVWGAVGELGLGTTWWEYSVADEAWNEEHLSIVDGAGVEAEVLVEPLARPYPALLAGADPVTTADGDGWVFTWTPTEGVTELRWPSRRGPVAVEAEGATAEARGDRVYVVAEPGVAEVRVRLAPAAR